MSEYKKIIAQNKKAYHEYVIEDKIETGIILAGSEVKYLRFSKKRRSSYFSDSVESLEWEKWIIVLKDWTWNCSRDFLWTCGDRKTVNLFCFWGKEIWKNCSDDFEERLDKIWSTAFCTSFDSKDLREISRDSIIKILF